MILHRIKKDTWEEIKDKRYFGEVNIEVDRFIGLSPFLCAGFS